VAQHDDSYRKRIVQAWREAEATGETQEAFAARVGHSSRTIRFWCQRFSPPPASAQRVVQVLEDALATLQTLLAATREGLIPDGADDGARGRDDQLKAVGNGSKPTTQIGNERAISAPVSVGTTASKDVPRPIAQATPTGKEPTTKARTQNFSWDE
jgi:hypothetical protein